MRKFLFAFLSLFQLTAFAETESSVKSNTVDQQLNKKLELQLNLLSFGNYSTSLSTTTDGITNTTSSNGLEFSNNNSMPTIGMFSEKYHFIVQTSSTLTDNSNKLWILRRQDNNIEKGIGVNVLYRKKKSPTDSGIDTKSTNMAIGLAPELRYATYFSSKCGLELRGAVGVSYLSYQYSETHTDDSSASNTVKRSGLGISPEFETRFIININDNLAIVPSILLGYTYSKVNSDNETAGSVTSGKQEQGAASILIPIAIRASL